MDSPLPTSSTRPSLSRPLTISETVVRVRLVALATSARLIDLFTKIVRKTRSRL